MMKKIIVTSVITPLLWATSALAYHVPSINVDAKGIANHDDYKLGIVSTNIVMPFFENKNSILFGDLRFSRTNHDVNGMHFGLGMRKTINGFTLGLNGFYDNYISEEQYGQYVVGFEAFQDSFKLRGTFYSPFNNLDAFKGVELEGTMQLAWISLSAKPYYFFHKTEDAIKGIGLNAKFEMPLSIFNIYAGAGYQFDTNYRHQATVQFGARVALGKNSDGEFKTIPPIERNMFIYGDLHNEIGKKEIKKKQADQPIAEALTDVEKLTKKAADGKQAGAKKDELQRLDNQLKALQTNFEHFTTSKPPANQMKFVEAQLKSLIASAKKGQATSEEAHKINDKMIVIMDLNTMASTLSGQDAAFGTAQTALKNTTVPPEASAVPADITTDVNGILSDIDQMSTQAGNAKAHISDADKATIDGIKTKIDAAKTAIKATFDPLAAAATGADEVDKKSARTDQVNALKAVLTAQLVILKTQSEAINTLRVGQIKPAGNNEMKFAPLMTQDAVQHMQGLVDFNSANINPRNSGMEDTLNKIYELKSIMNELSDHSHLAQSEQLSKIADTSVAKAKELEEATEDHENKMS